MSITERIRFKLWQKKLLKNMQLSVRNYGKILARTEQVRKICEECHLDELWDNIKDDVEYLQDRSIYNIRRSEQLTNAINEGKYNFVDVLFKDFTMVQSDIEERVRIFYSKCNSFKQAYNE